MFLNTTLKIEYNTDSKTKFTPFLFNNLPFSYSSSINPLVTDNVFLVQEQGIIQIRQTYLQTKKGLVAIKLNL